MRLLLILFISLIVSLQVIPALAQEQKTTPVTAPSSPKFLVAVKGDIKDYIKDYIPGLKIYGFVESTVAATTGIVGNIPHRIIEQEDSLYKATQKKGEKFCKGSFFYAIDHYDLSFAIFGKYSNIAVVLTSNIVCLRSK